MRFVVGSNKSLASQSGFRGVIYSARLNLQLISRSDQAKDLYSNFQGVIITPLVGLI